MKKALRVRNAPLLNLEQERKLRPRGGVADESMPRDAVEAIDQNPQITEPDLMKEELGTLLGRYRMQLKFDDRLSISEEIDIALGTVSIIEELRRRLRHGPETVTVRGNNWLWQKQGATIFQLGREVDPLLRKLAQALSAGVEDARELLGHGGRKEMWQRHMLLQQADAASLRWFSSPVTPTSPRFQ